MFVPYRRTLTSFPDSLHLKGVERGIEPMTQRLRIYPDQLLNRGSVLISGFHGTIKKSQKSEGWKLTPCIFLKFSKFSRTLCQRIGYGGRSPAGVRGPFLEHRPGNFSGPKSDIQIEI